jgi:hypothetical protein
VLVCPCMTMNDGSAGREWGGEEEREGRTWNIECGAAGYTTLDDIYYQVMGGD